MATIMTDRAKFGHGGTPIWFEVQNHTQYLTDGLTTPMYGILEWCVEHLEGNVFFERDPFSILEEFYDSNTKYILWFSDPNAAFAFKIRWK